MGWKNGGGKSLKARRAAKNGAPTPNPRARGAFSLLQTCSQGYRVKGVRAFSSRLGFSLLTDAYHLNKVHSSQSMSHARDRAPGERRIWREYLGRHVERVIKPLRARTSSMADSVRSPPSRDIWRFNKTPSAHATRWRRRWARIEIAGLERGWNKLKLRRAHRSHRAKSGGGGVSAGRKEGAPHDVAVWRRGSVKRSRESGHFTWNPRKTPAAAPTTLSDLIRGGRPLAVSF